MVGPGEKLPGVLGASVPNVNNLSMTSKGWELTISWRDRIGDFSYGITANLYDHTTTIDEYPNENKALSTAYWPGKKLGEIWGFRTVGLAKTDEEMQQHFAKMEEAYKLAHRRPGSDLQQSPVYPRRTGWQAGDVMYKDIDGDGVISQGEFTADNSGDYVVIGNTTPRYCFGLNLDAQWKGFDVKVFFQGIGKRDYWVGNGNAMFFGASGISLAGSRLPSLISTTSVRPTPPIRSAPMSTPTIPASTRADPTTHSATTAISRTQPTAA